MIVKKKNPEWQPSENPYLKVGETIEITDPKNLILSGDVIPMDDDGNELSPYDLYGVVVKSEMDEFLEWRQLQQQKALQAQLEKERATLEAELKSEAEETSITPAPVTESPAQEPSSQKVDDTWKWQDLTKLGAEMGVYVVGMKKAELIDAINNA